MKLSILVVVLFSYLTAVRTDEKRPLPMPCSEIYRCTLEPNPIWATDGKRCYVFINPCQLDLENCNRGQVGLYPLEPIDKEKCECRLDCPECDKPVCGSLGCQLLNFPSLCWMDYYNCKSGQVYTLHNWGQCEEKWR